LVYLHRSIIQHLQHLLWHAITSVEVFLSYFRLCWPVFRRFRRERIQIIVIWAKVCGQPIAHKLLCVEAALP
jgi:hypothetical protein